MGRCWSPPGMPRWEQEATLAELEVFTERGGGRLPPGPRRQQRPADRGRVAELLGWLPLALEQAGAYVRETRIALSAYLDRLRQFPPDSGQGPTP